MAPQSTFPQELPPRPAASGSWKDRNCPGIKSCLFFDWSAYSLATTETPVVVRRICQWVVLLIYATLGIWGLIKGVYGANIVGWIIGAIIVVLAFFWMAHCLAGIGQVTGRRRVLGALVGRWHFDIFLAVAALIFIALLIANFVRNFPLGNVGFLTTWYGMWVLIVATWWITTWTPEPESYV